MFAHSQQRVNTGFAPSHSASREWTPYDQDENFHRARIEAKKSLIVEINYRSNAMKGYRTEAKDQLFSSHLKASKIKWTEWTVALWAAEEQSTQDFESGPQYREGLEGHRLRRRMDNWLMMNQVYVLPESVIDTALQNQEEMINKYVTIYREEFGYHNVTVIPFWGTIARKGQYDQWVRCLVKKGIENWEWKWKPIADVFSNQCPFFVYKPE